MVWARSTFWTITNHTEEEHRMNVRPIFLIHGVGNHKKGEFLSAVVEPWIQFLYRKLGSTNVSAQMDLRPEHGPANAVLEFENERWEIWEAHWQDSFYPLKSSKALFWGFMILYQHGWSMLKGLIPKLRGKSPYDNSTNAVYEKRPKPVVASINDRLIGWLAFIFFLSVYPFTLALATVFFVLSQLPLGVVSQKLQQITARITDGLVQGPGDMPAILLSESRSLSIRGQLADLLHDRIPEGGLHAMIVAHSAGTTVSTAVLTDPKLWETWNATNKTPGSISFLTFGSSLNLAWRTSPEHKLWKMQPLDDRIRWIDFWARYDPISHGPAILEMKEKVRGPGAGVF
jgi:hypothetical protein